MKIVGRTAITIAASAAAYLAGFTLTVETRQGVAASRASQQTVATDPPPTGRGIGGRGRNPFEGADLGPKPPIKPLPPSESQKLFILPPGYRMEPVLTEPRIAEPMQIAFDGNGRMFVLEIRGYMQDADATGELDPTGRISVHQDTDQDGVYDEHHVFVDKLVFPRFVMPFGANSVLTMESNADEVYRYTDTNGDSVADRKELFATRFGRSGNVEHQQASLTWAMDNWLYSTYNAFRIRWTPARDKDGQTLTLREPTGPNGAQWGITQDDDGKVWFQGGASGLPSYFQFPVHYGSFNQPEQLEPGFEIAYGSAGVADYQPGMGSVRLPDQTLTRVTGAAGNDIYRGDRLPKELLGDYFYGEPVARIVRRIRPVVTGGVTQLRQVYQSEQAEFIRTRDHLFRPVDITTAPDGTMYITDTYRGIIQQATWVNPGSYLRAKVEQYQLDKVIQHGRIWRLTYDGLERDRRQPRMLDETPGQLVAHLSHPNGWWRDTAQQLIVLSQDRSVVPALEELIRTTKSPLARIHALWTLEGLSAVGPALVQSLLREESPRIRIHATRVSESLYKAGDRSLVSDVRALTQDPNPDVAIQAMLTLNVLRVPGVEEIVQAAQAKNPARGVQAVARQILAAPAAAFGRGGRGRGPVFTPGELDTMQKGDAIYKELCFSCHGDDGRGTPEPGAPLGTLMAPSLVGSSRVTGHRDYVIKTLLHGLQGPVEGQTYTGGVMAPMGANTDEWVAAIASYVRNTFGNVASFVLPAEVARIRAAEADRRELWTFDSLLASLPRAIPAQPAWRATASHNPERAMGAFSFASWTTGAPQEPGMWFQIELPQPARVTEIQFTSPGMGGGGGRGRGRGGRGTAAAPAGPQPAPADSQGSSGAAVPAQTISSPQAPAAAQATGRGLAPFTPAGTYPRGYKVEVSSDGSSWSTIAEGQGRGAHTSIAFAPVTAKFIRLTQTAAPEDSAPAWAIHRLVLYAPPNGGR
ncbi:MAG TPA: PVC-type heme-binding CxxCH protein [Vicinamibacterales bacterium]|nr:PVC-type heme-binding CxxCH protein [Vicinamibacterales bacterium]